MKNILISFISIFSVFALTNSVSASTTDNLQPASAHVIDQELQVLGTARVYSLRVGAQGYGGVTYFNGTIINETADSDGVEMPVTFGDDVRIDGQVWRGATSGPEADGSTPFVINDNLEVLGTIQGSNIVGANQLTTSNTGSSGQVLSLNSSGVLEWTDDATGGSSGSSGDITGVTAGSGLSGGGTSGAVTLSVSGVTSSMITDRTIVAGDIASNAVTSAKILNETIVSADIDDGTITGADLVSAYQSGSTYDSRFLNDDTDETMTGVLTISGASSSGEQMLNVTNTTNGSRAITGTASGTGSGTAGIIGLATGATGNSYGGYFQSSSTTGYGVYSTATGSGTNYGGYFRTSSTTGHAVHGIASASTGINYGGYFESASDGGRAVYAHASGAADENYAGYFEADNGVAVYAIANYNGGAAVYGNNSDAIGNSGHFVGANFTVALGVDSDFYINTNGGGVGIENSNPDQALDVEGLVGLQITNTPGTCNATNEGAIYYDAGNNRPCFCDGAPANWREFDGITDCD